VLLVRLHDQGSAGKVSELQCSWYSLEWTPFIGLARRLQMQVKLYSPFFAMFKSIFFEKMLT
jgi:hypothetical protein